MIIFIFPSDDDDLEIAQEASEVIGSPKPVQKTLSESSSCKEGSEAGGLGEPEGMARTSQVSSPASEASSLLDMMAMRSNSGGSSEVSLIDREKVQVITANSSERSR